MLALGRPEPDAPGSHAPEVVRRRVPDYEEEYTRRGWRMFPGIDRVYVNERARRELGWRPRYDFRRVLDLLKSGVDIRSSLALVVGSKGYHSHRCVDGPYSVQDGEGSVGKDRI